MTERKIPQFANEAEEARWWFEHRDEIGGDLVSASRQGRAGEGSVARHARKARELKQVPCRAQRGSGALGGGPDRVRTRPRLRGENPSAGPATG